MGKVLIFPLFAREGIVNPTPWPQPSPELPDEKYGPAFFDADTGKWHVKQGPRFDGGWRWYESDMVSAITIYNVLFDRRAYADITHLEIENCDPERGTTAEFILHCAKIRCLLDHNFYAASDHVQAYIQRLARLHRRDIHEDLRGSRHDLAG